MLGALALIAVASALDPQALPQLPERGLARDTRAGVELQTMQGRPLGVLPRLNLAPDVATSSDLLMRDGRGSLFVLDRRARTVRQVSDGPPPRRACRTTDRRKQLRLIVCKSTIRIGNRIVARAPGKIGHWERAAFAPSGDAFFAQWSAECEIPMAYLVVDGVMRRYGKGVVESAALGWLPNGSAVIHFPRGACGGSHRDPGVYAVPRSGKPTLLVRTPKFEYYWMWGG